MTTHDLSFILLGLSIAVMIVQIWRLHARISALESIENKRSETLAALKKRMLRDLE